MKVYTKIAGLVLIQILLSISIKAQIHGLWETTSVKVGDEIMTPIAKWSNLHQDGTFTSGNGWLQNSDGTWEYDQESNELQMTIVTGFENKFGPFKVEMVNSEEMIWTRYENGELVTVVNKRITSVQKNPATMAVGLWMVTEAIFGNQVKTDEFKESEFHAVFVRWDNLLQEITTEGRRSGMWRIDAHRPVIDILYYDGSKPLQYWDLDFENENSMTWKRGGMIISFERLTSFPED